MGLILISSSAIPWLLLPSIPFLKFLPSLATKTAATTGLIVLGEILFWSGIFLSGRESWKIIRSHGLKKAPSRIYHAIVSGRVD